MKANRILGLFFLLLTAHARGGEPIFAEEVAKHSTASDCWMIVENSVYELTSYLSAHEKYTKALPDFCGKNATEAWNTKSEKQKPHSKKAAIFLKKYKIGQLKE